MEVGTERDIRADGFLPLHLRKSRVDRPVRTLLTPLQVLAVSALSGMDEPFRLCAAHAPS